MSLKTLWQKQKEATKVSNTIIQKSVQDFSSEVESSEYITQYKNSLNLYLQDVNFATASNFAKFGIARKYYENISNRITNYFPYDGSKAEQLEFENNLNPFEKYIYLYEYPRSSGYVTFSPNGWGSQTSITNGFGNPNTKEYISFYNINNNNVYDPDNNLRENTRFIFASGSTIEFWLKKNGFDNSKTQKEVIFYTATTGSANKDKRMAVYVSGGSSNTSSIYTSYYTENVPLTINEEFLFELNTGLTTVADSRWHHYAIVYYSSSNKYAADLYVDGVYRTTNTIAGPVVDFTGSSIATIGSLGGKLIGTSDLTGYGKLSGSIDEFRFWNEKRNAKQVGLNYFVGVGGGNNVANVTNLGIYYKFNEGITQSSTTDAVILDYAGRNCNGLFTGYSTNSRNTGSAITDTQEKPEIKTPILYSEHPDVQSYLEEKLVLADEYDFNNNFSLKNSMPAWILDDDAKNGDILINFLQTLSSYLDTLYLQTTTFKGLKNKDYLNYEGKAPPFSSLLLTSNGFDLPDLFLNTDIVQSLLGQDNKRTYDESIDNLKNVIYKNIYNNLELIYKSKGTEKAIKYLIKSFGVSEDVFALNIYANNTTYKLEDSYANNSVKKSYIDFTPFVYSQNSEAVIYQNGSYISGASVVPITVECDFITPSFPTTYDILAYQTLTYNTSSIFGIRTADTDPSILVVSSSDTAGLKAKLIYRDNKGYFSLSGSALTTELTSSVFDDLMENQHWNVSFRVVPNTILNNYKIIFSGYCNTVGDQFREFEVSGTVNNTKGEPILINAKRLYVGAERENITGAIAYPSIIKTLSARFWADSLDGAELKEHARNPDNYGRLSPNDSYALSNTYIPKSETLLLHWDFSVVSSSDSNGDISIIYDISSNNNSRYSSSPLSSLLGVTHNGAGRYFQENATVQGTELVFSSEQQLPENLYSSQLVSILEADDNYSTNIRPQKYFFALENSMYDTISKNMLNMFASVIEFNNLIGEPINNYKSQYSKMKSFRRVFFDKVQNDIDLDKYVGVYKWIDDALDSILFNLLPASANISEKARIVIENHILERSKIAYPLTPDKNTKYIGGNKISEFDQLNPQGSGYNDPPYKGKDVVSSPTGAGYQVILTTGKIGKIF